MCEGIPSLFIVASHFLMFDQRKIGPVITTNFVTIETFFRKKFGCHTNYLVSIVTKFVVIEVIYNNIITFNQNSTHNVRRQ